MARFNLNEALKKKAAAKQLELNPEGGELALDDVSRVKVLSPGRKVFKRFIRNRLAIFGSVLLITMFVLAFIGPLFYAYGQKDIFYKYITRTINYGMAKENTMFNAFDIDTSVDIELLIGTAVNSQVKTMQSQNQTSKLVRSAEGRFYTIEQVEENSFTLSAAEGKEICIYGSGTVYVGNFDTRIKKITFDSEVIEGLDAEVAKAVKDKKDSFVYNGVTYTLKAGAAKSQDVYMEFDGVRYTGEAKDAAFEALVEEAVQTGNNFEYEGAKYGVVTEKTLSTIYEISNERVAKLYSRLMVDTYENGISVSTELRTGAVLALNNGGSFTADGKNWTVKQEEGLLIGYDESGAEYMEESIFSVRRYNGDDSMALDLKKAVKEKIEEMQDSGSKTDKLTYILPMQNEEGQYVYDENGNCFQLFIGSGKSLKEAECLLKGIIRCCIIFTEFCFIDDFADIVNALNQGSVAVLKKILKMLYLCSILFGDVILYFRLQIEIIVHEVHFIAVKQHLQHGFT